MKKKKLLNKDMIFYIAIFLLPFENFCIAPSSGWATITPIILALYIILEFKIFFKEILKFKKVIIFFSCAMLLTVLNYFYLGFKIANTVNALISLGLGFVSLFSFDIYYNKNKEIGTIIKILIVSYVISIFIGILQYITIKFNIEFLYNFFNLIFKRDYLQYNRIQFFFTEPSFIGMHIFGVLLPAYFISKNKKVLSLIIVFCVLSFVFSSGVRILLDICIIGIILLFEYLIKNKKIKLLIIIPILGIIALGILYTTNYRVRQILDKGIYADGSLATRYFRIQSSVYGYTKKPGNLLLGYGLGNALIPLQDGYEDAIVTYKSTYMDEVGGLNNPNIVEDSVSYCLYIRFISEFGLILFIIAMAYIISITKNSTFNYKYSYLLITLYLYLQFESYAFYAMWIFILVMLYTKKIKNIQKEKILVGYVEDGVSGGIDKYLMNFLESIDTKEYQLDFITKKYNSKMEELLKNKGCKLYEVAHNRNPIKQYKQMRKIIQSERYGVAYFNISETFNFIGVLAAKLNGIPKVVVHSHSSGSDKSSKIKRVISGILNFLCKPIIDICSNEKIACSKNAAMWMYTKKIVKCNNYITIYNAIDEKKFAINEEKRQKIRNKYQLENKFVIGHVGRFTYQKNHELLLRIFSEVIKKRDDAILICIGEGENFENIKELAESMGISKKIIFTGNINNVDEYMQAFDLFVLPSRFEGLPIVGVEAQMSGLPCLFSKNISDEVIISTNSKLLDCSDETIWVNEIFNVKERKNELLEIAEKYKKEEQKEQFEQIIQI